MILDLLTQHGITPKRASSNKGGEYHSPCPRCGGDDRFHVWPEQYDGQGSFWCRGCDLGGDCIKFLMEYNGLSFKDAAARCGKELEQYSRYSTPAAPKQQRAAQPQARECLPPAQAWQQAARELVEKSHAALLENQQQLDYLAGRGIDREAVIFAQLGWVGTEKKNCEFSSRKKWGVPPKVENKKPDAFWFPRGILIPNIIDDRVDSIRIRRPKADRVPPYENLDYHVVPEGGKAPQLYYAGQPVIVVVEAQLDAITCHSAAGDLVGVLALGNSSARPDERSMAALQHAKLILVALDFDKPDHSGRRAGGQGWARWQQEYDHAKRWPVPAGKDPGDAYQQGVDIRAWIMAGMPKVWHTTSVQPQAEQPAEEQPEIAVQNYRSKGGQHYKLVATASQRDQLWQPDSAIFATAELTTLAERVEQGVVSADVIDTVISTKRQIGGGVVCTKSGQIYYTVQHPSRRDNNWREGLAIFTTAEHRRLIDAFNRQLLPAAAIDDIIRTKRLFGGEVSASDFIEEVA